MVRPAMKPWKVIDRAKTPDGEELVLSQRGDDFVIRVAGRELMSSRRHGSEERLAEVACEKLAGKRPRFLVGGLGMGFTVRAALDRLPPGAEVVVAELVPAVVEWNRGPLAELAGRPLEDARVRVEARDVGDLLRAADGEYDAVLLDVDNGPEALTQESNRWLYGERGLASILRALRKNGVLVVWSASSDRPFANRMKKAGFFVDVEETAARGKSGGPLHTLFIGRAR
jgi:spermidine synthase